MQKGEGGEGEFLKMLRKILLAGRCSSSNFSSVLCPRAFSRTYCRRKELTSDCETRILATMQRSNSVKRIIDCTFGSIVRNARTLSTKISKEEDSNSGSELHDASSGDRLLFSVDHQVVFFVGVHLFVY